MSQLELPKGWINCQFKEIVCVNPKVIANDEDLSGFIPMSHAPVNFFDSFKYDERNWGEIKKKYTNFADGDVIFAKVTPCFENGKAALLEGLPNGIGAGSSEFYVLRPLNSTILSKYVFSIIKSAEFLTNGERSMTGAVGLRRVPRSFVENFEVNLPPLAEQKVIADKLDTLLAQVESIKTRLERIFEILKQFRQSVLAAAVTGKLTEEWRGNVSYSRMDLKLIKSNILIDIPTTWIVKKLKDSCDVVSGNAFKSGDFLEKGDVPAIKISNVQYGEFEEKNQQYLPSHFIQEFKGFIVKPDDVLMALTRPITNNTLKVCRYPKSQPVALLNQRVAKFDFKDELEKAFFELLFQSNYFKGQVIDNLSETLQPNLSPVDLKSFLIGVPPPNEQVEIVRLVAGLFRSADVIERQVQSALDRVSNLTQSILAKAFRGELTAEWRIANPDLISGENSAEALLERIKAERKSAKPATKRGRGKA